MKTSYRFFYRRYDDFFWKKISRVIGHDFDKESNLMTIFLENGGIQTIRNWSFYELKLKGDFGLFMKDKALKEAKKL